VNYPWGCPRLESDVNRVRFRGCQHNTIIYPNLEKMSSVSRKYFWAVTT
jgi:hypothetical protein